VSRIDQEVLYFRQHKDKGESGVFQHISDPPGIWFVSHRVQKGLPCQSVVHISSSGDEKVVNPCAMTFVFSHYLTGQGVFELNA
jgi:hypothetical protein